MASESLAIDTAPDAGPKAFAGYDECTFLSWIEAIADVMQSVGDPESLDKNTVPILGGLILSLVKATDEVSRQPSSA